MGAALSLSSLRLTAIVLVSVAAEVFVPTARGDQKPYRFRNSSELSFLSATASAKEGAYFKGPTRTQKKLLIEGEILLAPAPDDQSLGGMGESGIFYHRIPFSNSWFSEWVPIVANGRFYLVNSKGELLNIHPGPELSDVKPQELMELIHYSGEKGYTLLQIQTPSANPTLASNIRTFVLTQNGDVAEIKSLSESLIGIKSVSPDGIDLFVRDAQGTSQQRHLSTQDISSFLKPTSAQDQSHTQRRSRTAGNSAPQNRTRPASRAADREPLSHPAPRAGTAHLDLELEADGAVATSLTRMGPDTERPPRSSLIVSVSSSSDGKSVKPRNRRNSNPAGNSAPNSAPDASGAALIEIRKNKVFVLPKQGYLKGRHIDLRLRTQGVDLDDSGNLAIMTRDFEYLGHRYVIVHAPLHEEDAGGNNGETYLVRDDGLSCLFGHRASDLNDFEIKSGFFTLAGVSRSLDLDRFESETWIPSFPRAVVKGAENKPIVIEDEVAALTTQMSDDVRAMRSTAVSGDRDTEYRLRTVIARNNVRNAVLLGPAGSAKTTTLDIFARMALNGEFPEIPRTVKILKLDAATLGAGGENVGTIESRVKALIEYSKIYGWVLILMDELHSLAGQGAHSNNSNDALQLLKTNLANGVLSALATDTEGEFDDAFSTDGAFYQRWIKIYPRAKSREEVLNALKSQAAQFTPVEPAPEILGLIHDLSDYFNGVDALPRKGVLLLESLYSILRVENRVHSTVTREDVYRAAQSLYRTDMALFDANLRRERILAFETALNRDFVGQPELKGTLFEAAVQAYSGVQDPSKPKGRILITGPKGHGKTTVAELFAKHFGVPSLRVKMQNFQEGSDSNALLQVIAKALRVNAHTVIILDDIEKAGPTIQTALFEILDKGIFSVREKKIGGNETGQLLQVDARHAFVFATSNAAQEIRSPKGVMGFSAGASGGSGGEIDSIDPATYEAAIVRGGIVETVLSRLPFRIPLHTVTRDEMRIILGLELKKIIAEQTSAQRRSIEIEDQDAVVENILKSVFDKMPQPDPRVVIGALDSSVRSALGRSILETRTPDAPLCPKLLHAKK